MCKVRQYQLTDLGSIPDLDWFGLKLRPESTIGSYPWQTMYTHYSVVHSSHKCRDGDYFLVKDNRQQEVRAHQHKVTMFHA